MNFIDYNISTISLTLVWSYALILVEVYVLEGKIGGIGKYVRDLTLSWCLFFLKLYMLLCFKVKLFLADSRLGNVSIRQSPVSKLD